MRHGLRKARGGNVQTMSRANDEECSKPSVAQTSRRDPKQDRSGRVGNTAPMRREHSHLNRTMALSRAVLVRDPKPGSAQPRARQHSPQLCPCSRQQSCRSPRYTSMGARYMTHIHKASTRHKEAQQTTSSPRKEKRRQQERPDPSGGCARTNFNAIRITANKPTRAQS